ncbi:hypothetical protein BCD67_24825 [Oscillatoriales cyanobacterium USR001]|nr:hypothetical protein BCD67_24825 [Oscillatoriales cyanobacterium USR001]
MKNKNEIEPFEEVVVSMICIALLAKKLAKSKTEQIKLQKQTLEEATKFYANGKVKEITEFMEENYPEE